MLSRGSIVCPQAIAAWEQAARLIQKRELLLSRLEDFERKASDPNRFFQRGTLGVQTFEIWILMNHIMTLIQIDCKYTGYHGSSIARLEEASQREKLNSQISVVDQELSKTMGHITTRFSDNISYKVSALNLVTHHWWSASETFTAVLVVTGSAVQREDALGPHWDAVLAAAGEAGPVSGDVCRWTDGFACKASSSETKPGDSLRQPSNHPETTSFTLWGKCPVIATLQTLKNIAM